ncbi:MAG: phospho-N-acetylmuramoyl-pentapeptide-transferase [Spirochaetia bacterium]|nr:phospho-N-acetylmuramoyl-pentapeptide-transferase [Spirochaetia bacterium]
MLRMLVVQAVCSFLLTFLISKVLLSICTKSKVAIKPELAHNHAAKQGTPVVGGLAFSIGFILTNLMTSDLRDYFVLLPMIALTLFLLVGFLDDLQKQKTKNGDGLSSRAKLLLQFSSAVVIVLLAKHLSVLDTHITFFKGSWDLGYMYFVFAVFYLLYFVNAVNITDGLDALASGASLPVLLLLVLLSQRFGFAMIGSLLAFLYFNRSPAKYFMGDAGSHALGGYIGICALLINAELVFVVASGLFLLELSSSLIQIISIRGFQKKVFTIAPLHHAYEMKGIKEEKIVASCIAASWLFASLALLISRN